MVIRKLIIGFCLIFVAAASAVAASENAENRDTTNTPPVRRVNVSHDPELRNAQAAIFWFGEVTPINNYADVRITYDDERLQVTVHVIDQWLWRDLTPSPAELEQWDAVTLYLNTGGNKAAILDQDSYRFVAQLSHHDHEPREPYQNAYSGDDSAWLASEVTFQSTSGWRGEGLNDGSEARGWHTTFQIPFDSVGLPGPPSRGEIWGLGVSVHDRDDAAGSPIPDETWPESLDPSIPSTWGQLHFGLPGYAPPLAMPHSSTIVRQGLDGMTVIDGHVGGNTECGQQFWPDRFFDEWGEATYDGGEAEANIQNQWDIADWPCFSKYYVTFPLPPAPPGTEFLAATLTLHQFGNAGEDVPGGPQPSLIQVSTLLEDWEESSLTWNNAPLAQENVSAAWVDPISGFPGWPGIPQHWNVSRAVAEAYEAGRPLQLVLYSADTAYHSGKYFVTSDTGDWNASARPALRIVWGDPTIEPDFTYLPALFR